MKNKISGEVVDYILVVIANLAFALIFIFGNYRLEWFGVLPDYAPHNFGFNVGIIIPLTLICFVLSLLVIFRVFLSWKKRINKMDSYFLVFFSLPAIILIVRIFVFLVIDIFTYDY